jgi:enoyl-CoA hydratase/carnithine racemase
MLTGRFINAQRALATGLVPEVAQTTGSKRWRKATSHARDFADRPCADAPISRLRWRIENRNWTLCAGTEDFAEGMRAFLEQRKPVYRDA